MLLGYRAPGVRAFLMTLLKERIKMLRRQGSHMVTVLDSWGLALIQLARRRGKVYLRLDCTVNNGPLNRYYEEQGYVFAGTCDDGAYGGNLRQKRV